MVSEELSLEQLLPRLEKLANKSLSLWTLPKGAQARLINISENATFIVTAQNGFRSILRVHREEYHTERAIECELLWSRALDEEGGVENPAPVLGKNGKAVQSFKIDELPSPRFVVMFDFVEGIQPDENHDLVAPFESLGKIAAKTHLHSIRWQKPLPFERLTWDLNTVFGPLATWGDWREGPNLDPHHFEILEATEALLQNRLTKYGQGPDRFGLIHADMRLANLIIKDNGEPQLIDFDDCGHGWFLYDFATGISFMEDHPQVPDLKRSWLKGYQSIRPLSDEDLNEMDSFVMLRRMALLAWIGSHIEAPEPQALAPDFARVTAELASVYLKEYG